MVRPGSPGIRLLENLPQRPPTPPRESDHSKVQAEGPVLRRVLSDTLGVHTPPNNSPEPLHGSSNGTSDKSRKRVGWSAWTEYKELPIKNSPLQDGLRPLPPSGELKPTKSILKPYNGVNPIDRRSGTGKLAAPHTYPNFATMLESIIKQLAGEDRSSRIDAYLTLSGVLKASDDVPDPKALKEKMGLLTQFIQRDMSVKTASGTLDTVVINNALSLLAIFVWNPPIADWLSNEFCTYVVEHAISAIKDPLVSKDIVKHILFILGRQNFSAKVMNAERARRLIETLVNIEEHVKGRSIVLGRVSIYRKLLRQARTSMLASVPWVENLFADMTSNSREVRAPAVAFGSEAALLLGTEKQVSRAVMDLFRRDIGEIKYAHSYSKRLGLMVQNKQDGDLVPQIWSIVVLFLRYRTHQLEHWEFMMPWMHVIEKCFNSSDHDIKTQANLAWNRLVFAIQPDESTVPTMVKFLGKVLDLQLKRKLMGRHAKEARQITIGSVCNLLYYALNPNATASQLDLYWDEYMIQLVGKTLVARDQVHSETEEEDLAHACDIISALLDISPKAWINNRATETAIVKADELPSIDPKWIRKNAERVFKVLGPMIQKYFNDLIKWESSIELLWSKFVASVGAAGAKEVKVSNDTMSSVACVFTLLYKLWETGPKDLPGDESSLYQPFQKTFTLLVTMTISSLGVLPFTERLLAMGPQDNFAIVATPSHHPHKPQGEIKCPLHHLFVLLARPPSGVDCDDGYLEMAKNILEPFFEDRKTRRSRIELAKDLCQLLPLLASDTQASQAPLVLWQVLAGFAMMSFDLKTVSGTNSSSTGSLDQPLGTEYRNLVKILEYGILLSLTAPLPEWKELLAATIAQVTSDAGQSGRAISIIEPLSRALEDRIALKEQMPSIAYCTILVSNALYPVDKQSLEAARRRLWGISNHISNSASLDPYSHFYVYLRYCLQQSYSSLVSDISVDAFELLSSVSTLVHGCPISHANGLLVGIQDGLAPWVLDQTAKFGGRKSSMLANSVAMLWSSICDHIANLPQTDSSLLRSLETLICSGFESRHKHTVSTMISLWNFTFGSEPDLEYPPRVTEAVLRLRPIADIRLPSFPECENEATSTGPIFEDGSQEDNLPYDLEDYNMLRSSTSRERTPHLEPSPLPQGGYRTSPNLTVGLPHSGSRKRAFQGTPENNKRKVAKKNITPKLRHDDSQIQFAAIDSSPLTDAVLDSQLLTDRQREVKERQREMGAVFVNIGASPRLRTKSGFSHLTPSSDPSALKQTSPDGPSTPDLPVQEKALFDEYITSSPTPCRGGFNVQMDTDLTDPPSSPPEQSLSIANQRIFVSGDSRRYVDSSKPDFWDAKSSPPVRLQGVSRSSSDLGYSAQVEEVITIAREENYVPVTGNSIEHDEITGTQLRPRTPVETIGSLALERQASRTPNDVFVDALSSPAPPTPAMDINSGQLYITEVQDDERTASPKLVKQNDSQIAYSLSEADEDSMLRLITKFDIPVSRQDHIHNEMSPDIHVRESDPLSEGRVDSPTANIKQTSMVLPLSQTSGQCESQRLGYPSIESEPLRSQSIILKPLETSTRIKKAHPTGMGEIENATTPAEIDVQVSQQGMETHLQEIDKNRRIQRSTDTKRKIVDEDVEVPNSTVVNAIVSNVRIEEVGTSAEIDSHGLDDNICLMLEAEQSTSFMDLEKQIPGGVGDVNSDQDSNTSVFTTKSQNFELSILQMHKQNSEMNNQMTRGDYEAMCKSKDTTFGLVSQHEAEVGESGSIVIGRFEEILASLRAAALTREEAQRVENILWDVKGELYAAEKRGRVAS